jgi:hypothetical protein
MMAMEENFSQGLMVSLGGVFIALPVLAVGLRIWAKFLGRKGLKADDYLIFCALVCFEHRQQSLFIANVSQRQFPLAAMASKSKVDCLLESP